MNLRDIINIIIKSGTIISKYKLTTKSLSFLFHPLQPSFLKHNLSAFTFSLYNPTLLTALSLSLSLHTLVGNPMAVPDTIISAMPASLYVGDLHPELSDGALFEAFTEFKSLSSVRVCRDSSSGRSLCYGYVNFLSTQDGGCGRLGFGLELLF